VVPERMDLSLFVSPPAQKGYLVLTMVYWLLAKLSTV